MALVMGGLHAQSPPPNFILIVADDLGFGELGCYGHPAFSTPHIDTLAAGGIRFTDFHSNGAVCSPTRAALMTGRYQQRCGIEGVVTARNHRDTGMPLKEKTLAEVLRAKGYATGLSGKWHLGYPTHLNPIHQGFDFFRGFVSGNVDYISHIDQEMFADWWHQGDLRPETGYLTDLVTDHAVRFIEDNKDAPYFLCVTHGAPHYPYQGRRDPAQRHLGEARSGEKVPDLERRYREMIEALDDSVGRIVETVAGCGKTRETLIVFMSDNGPASPAVTLGNAAGPWRGRKAQLWEGGHRVAGIASWPGRIRPGQVNGELILGMDWFPTFAALAGVDTSRLELDGIDLSPVLFEGRDLPGRTVFWRTGRGKVARRGPWKLVRDKKKTYLFNLSNDPTESRNLKDKMPDRARRLAGQLSAMEMSWADVEMIAR